MRPAAELYLDLLKKSLTNWINGAAETEELAAEQYLKADALDVCRRDGVRVVRPRPFDPAQRAEGRDWPPTAETMAGLKRLDNLQACVESVLRDGVPGDLIETGVWRGGSCILMRAVLAAHGVTDRTVWVADSFAGLPPPNVEKYPLDRGLDLHRYPFLAVGLEQVRANFRKYDLLDERVKFLQGWFKDTLPAAPIERLAVMRLDGDLYESTTDALASLYPKLSVGGYVIIDDYGAVDACAQAVTDYRNRHGIRDEITKVDWTGAYWRRSR
jgi:O-methyltransferase